MSEPVHCYVARAPCGCIVAAFLDESEKGAQYAADQAAALYEWKSADYRAERVEGNVTIGCTCRLVPARFIEAHAALVAACEQAENALTLDLNAGFTSRSETEVIRDVLRAALALATPEGEAK